MGCCVNLSLVLQRCFSPYECSAAARCAAARQGESGRRAQSKDGRVRMRAKPVYGAIVSLNRAVC
eukprot:6022678-Pleurochrysis_carterae.AAC.2